MKYYYTFHRVLLILISLGFVAGIIIYSRYDPEIGIWAPHCMMKELTGLQCPSCGIQRCLHALLSGNWMKALNYNFFLALSLPYGFALIICKLFEWQQPFDCWLKKLISNQVIIIYVVLYFVWFIIRNIVHI